MLGEGGRGGLFLILQVAKKEPISSVSFWRENGLIYGSTGGDDGGGEVWGIERERVDGCLLGGAGE